MRKWSHKQEQVTVNGVIARLGSTFPMRTTIFRHVEQDGFKTLGTKELVLNLSVRYFDENREFAYYEYVVLLTDGAGKELQKTTYHDLQNAVNKYNEL